jgi:hypothetical protein
LAPAGTDNRIGASSSGRAHAIPDRANDASAQNATRNAFMMKSPIDPRVLRRHGIGTRRGVYRAP